MAEPPLHLGVALDRAGHHPAAWREPDARPAELFSPDYWAGQLAEAERGLLDLVTIEDSFGEDGAGEVTGRLDAVLIASRVAPLTRNIGIVPTAVVTHTEPFHLSKAIATLDYVSGGRAGIQVQISAGTEEAALFGRRAGTESTARLLAEAADYVEVVRRLWDSWEDGAEIRDAATGRFIDRDRLHYIDFTGEWFSVRGPSITPRPPQGQPLVASRTGSLGAATDLAFLTPADRAEAEQWIAGLGAERPAHVFADLLVFLDEDAETARERRSRLDALAGPAHTEAATFTGTPAELAGLLLDWRTAGLSGFRLLPASIPHDLHRITRELVPELQRRGAFRTAYEASTLRGLLGLSRPANRYAA
ncbi:LLM class flavin-dependent oxidoreductase [Sciscionella sediminilitoris]|uniref:LLM class flavin-dependent oxidoreductase n=1 Tax=Sciscionella sediminilitoris TaxID=1445613 RepID=UPI0004DFC1C9|nr:LLM class flavin-dependent oxidoreductase [Sciscionella sp. SE31]